MKLVIRVSKVFLLLCVLVACISCGQSNTKKEDQIDKISELEQMKYDNISKKIDLLCIKAQEAESTNSSRALQSIYAELRDLEYDYNPQGMGERAQQRCQALKKRLISLQVNPNDLLQSVQSDTILKASTSSLSSVGTILVARDRVKIKGIKRYAYFLKAKDKLNIALTLYGSVRATLFDINHQKRIRQWNLNGAVNELVPILSDGVYMLELRSSEKKCFADITLSYEGSKGARPHVTERIVSCRKGDFLAEVTDGLHVAKVFNEPKKIGLRGNLKSMFSGKSRALITVPVPSGSEAILYSLRISTNEKTVPSDGKFAENLSLASKQIKLFGINVYEKRTINSSVIDRLLFNTRPARDEDAFCNMYILNDVTEAKRFQDETASSAKYKYDVNQSQMGTQSCNGELKTKGRKTIYIGFENERMRYDNYIWLEVASLTHTKEYSRPVYLTR